MATKKKTKAIASSKAKKVTATKTVNKALKKTAKKSGVKKVTAPSKKAALKKKRTLYKPQSTPILTHGEDMYLIPVVGEIHPARKEEAPLLEKAYKHNTEVAFHQEQQRMKQIISKTRGVFKNPRQS